MISAKVNLLSSSRTDWEVTTGGGIKVPLSRKLAMKENVILPQELQPSSGAYVFVTHLFVCKGSSCKMRWFIVLNRTELNETNPQQYKFGNNSTTSIVISQAISESFEGLFTLRHEIKLHDRKYDALLPASGSNQIFLAPQINYTISGWNILFLYEIPLYQHMNKVQLGNRSASSVMGVKRFFIKRS